MIHHTVVPQHVPVHIPTVHHVEPVTYVEPEPVHHVEPVETFVEPTYTKTVEVIKPTTQFVSNYVPYVPPPHLLHNVAFRKSVINTVLPLRSSHVVHHPMHHPMLPVHHNVHVPTVVH